MIPLLPIRSFKAICNSLWADAMRGKKQIGHCLHLRQSFFIEGAEERPLLLQKKQPHQSEATFIVNC